MMQTRPTVRYNYAGPYGDLTLSNCMWQQARSQEWPVQGPAETRHGFLNTKLLIHRRDLPLPTSRKSGQTPVSAESI